MAPSTYNDVTQSTISRCDYELYYIRAPNFVVTPVTETKQQKIKRIAKQRMLASWNTHHQKQNNVKQVKQNCKPQHKL